MWTLIDIQIKNGAFCMKIIDFSDAMQQYRYTMKIRPCCSTESKGIYNADCVAPATVPNDWYAYDINTTGTGT